MRCALDGFAEAVSRVIPGPTPFPGAADSHEARPLTNHAQLVPAVTLTVRSCDPPPAAKLKLGGDRENRHSGSLGIPCAPAFPATSQSIQSNLIYFAAYRIRGA
jgi:hypothetical protein